MRECFRHKVYERWYRIAFDVEFGGDQRSDLPYVCISDVPFVRSRMHGYAFRSESLAFDSGLGNIRHVAASRIPYCCDLVDVDAQSGHFLSFD